eukprot:351775-Chlamydomonas_euryale.AAC.4
MEAGQIVDGRQAWTNTRWPATGVGSAGGSAQPSRNLQASKSCPGPPASSLLVSSAAKGRAVRECAASAAAVPGLRFKT